VSAYDSPRRGSAAPAARPPLKTSVPLDVGTHTKLCAAAALRGVTRSTLAAKFIKDGLRGVVVVDKKRSADPPDESDRRTEGDGSSLDGGDEAA